MSTGSIVLIVIIAVIVLAALWAVLTTNNFKRMEIKVNEGLSGIEVALEKRYDLLTKLLDAAKGYMTHEKEVFTDVIALRKGMSVDELGEAERQINRMSSDLLAVAENYPQLRSSDVFTELMGGIKDAEEHLQAARRLYNSNVSAFNTAIAMFPASLLAGGRSAKKFFEAADEKKKDVKMSF
ncbi:MAG: LemA family protein [Clostridiales bacterium]|nr:LemA family protein [Clostridiales bacterium]